MHKGLRHILIAAVMAAGCSGRTAIPKPDPIARTGEGLAGIQAHVESAERCTQGAVPHADAVGRVYLSSASAEHRAALDKTGEARATLDAARQEMRDMGGWGRRRTSCW